MVLHERLNDAAIALYQTLHEAGIKHGIVGGYAIGCMGGPRASKDVDCIAAASKEQAIQLLDGKNGFQWVGQSRMDYVAFLWSDLPDRAQPVLVEIFPETFPGKMTLDSSCMCAHGMDFTDKRVQGHAIQCKISNHNHV